MSNFLQRVAATVIQPKARLQPMLGSIFSPPALSLLAEPFPAQAETSSQRFAPHHHERMTAPHFNTPSHPFASQAFPIEEQWFPANAPPDSSATPRPAGDQPLLPAFSSPHDVHGTTHQHPFVEDPPSELSKSATANRPDSPDPYQPLIAASQQPPPKLQSRESLPTLTAARTSASEAARRAQPAQREADEIHIHIGRIEVAAIAQPAPRPAAAAARRSLNLDEYLRRGNGRPG